jgi:hypothetical protein
MQTLPHISSEGGPLLIADVDALRNWSGCYDVSDDYSRACGAIRSEGIGVLGDRILVWDIEGGGTAYLTQYDDRSFELLRFWTTDDPDDDAIRELARLTKPTGERASVRITASPAIVVWACEDTRPMVVTAIPGVPKGDWSMGGIVYCFPVVSGTYQADVGRFESAERAALSLTCTLLN